MNKESEKLVKILNKGLGGDFEKQLRKLILNIFENEQLIVGRRLDFDLITEKIKFSSLKMSDKEFLDSNCKPSFVSNDNNHYFGAEEIIKNNNRFIAITGEVWLKNDSGDEFVEAIIFGDHNIKDIDCMFGSVRINGSTYDRKYFVPGTIIILKPVEFKQTYYLDLIGYLPKMRICNEFEEPWQRGDFISTYQRKNGSYQIQEHNKSEFHQDESNGDSYVVRHQSHEDWLNDEFGDDAGTAYWNMN